MTASCRSSSRTCPACRADHSHDPGVYRNKTATDEFVAETVAGADYLKGICRELGIGVD